MSILRVGNVELTIPTDVLVETHSGRTTLTFSNFSGTVVVAEPMMANKRFAEGEEGFAAAKRARSGTPADDSQDSGEPAGDPAGLSALRTSHHEAFFRNGGGMSLSQLSLIHI